MAENVASSDEAGGNTLGKSKCCSYFRTCAPSMSGGLWLRSHFVERFANGKLFVHPLQRPALVNRDPALNYNVTMLPAPPIDGNLY
jgi:hypothetical protein